MMLRIGLAVAIGLGAMTSAFASSGDAWQAMRDKVRAGCLAKARSMRLGKVDANVDPFGTQNYGTAILIKGGTSRKSDLAYVCVMDKKTGEFEVGGEMTLR
ncbi:hypothetical protein IC232_20960 [Microvirga sp. BT688]|uniref:hypothetical protein n=1 Tax=Microvirga sp. TaxID=1873136 RepID=UPI001684E6F5|nr:hypothetical protein [Microvirga sp.]MBD2749155.1 hypothetical protein [Microvirga sp.]